MLRLKNKYIKWGRTGATITHPPIPKDFRKSKRCLKHIDRMMYTLATLGVKTRGEGFPAPMQILVKGRWRTFRPGDSLHFIHTTVFAFMLTRKWTERNRR